MSARAPLRPPRRRGAIRLDELRIMDLTTAFQTLGISLGLGLLVGMQRERVQAPLAGVRTFALISLFGTLTAMLSLTLGPWLVAAGVIGVAAMTATGNAVNMKLTRPDPGITTEIAILLMYAIGAYLVLGHSQVAVVLAGGVAVLLHAKPEMHGFVKRLGETDMRAMMQFVLITLVILPVLPDQAYGPFQVLNPREIWRMVVLVVAISLGGYVVLKLYGEQAGMILGGILGGVISSTATTVSYARRASHAQSQVAAATLVILLASTIVYLRVLVEVAVVARRVFPHVAPPIALMLVVSIVTCVMVWWKNRRLRSELPAQENPTQLKSAIVFGILFGLVLLAVAAARFYFGDRGIYAVAALSGLTDMDAITLTTSRLAARDTLSTTAAWRSILIAAIANLAFKTAIVGALGGTTLLARVAALFAIQVAAGLGILIFWPA
jgi:uncharacterized membrane protein (DUF4010 family)